MTESRVAGEEGGTRAVRAEVEIEAAPEDVWRALTDARELERWFPLEAKVEPGVGGSIWMSWKNEFAGESKILAWDPEKRLLAEWGNWDGTGAVQTTEYVVEGKGGKTVVRVVTSGFPGDATWDGWVEGTRRGWAYELESLKAYLERFRGRDREVVYLRRRVPLGEAEAWARITGPDGLGARPLGARAFHDEPGGQWAGATDDPPGLVRVSTEPTFGRDDTREVVLWLSAYGAEPGRIDAIRRDWTAMLERLYPEGEAPGGVS